MKIGFIASAFDLLHPGHSLALKEAKSLCDKLIIGLHTDPSIERSSKEKPLESVFERYLRVKSLFNDYADYEILPYDTEKDLFNMLLVYKPDIRFLGSEYKGNLYTGKDLDIPIHWIERKHNWSSSSLRDKIKKASQPQTDLRPV